MDIMKKRLVILLAGLLLIDLYGGGSVMASGEEGKKIKIFNSDSGKYEEVETLIKDKKEWREILTDEEFHVTREQGTERPFTGALLNNKEKGIYTCIACGTDFFSSETKYDSKTGWPSFWNPIAEENIGYTEDKTLFMKRVEVHCPRCGAHLGHVFDDGPPPTHKRFCINSAALKFKAKNSND